MHHSKLARSPQKYSVAESRCINFPTTSNCCLMPRKNDIQLNLLTQIIDQVYTHLWTLVVILQIQDTGPYLQLDHPISRQIYLDTFSNQTKTTQIFRVLLKSSKLYHRLTIPNLPKNMIRFTLYCEKIHSTKR